VKKIQTEIRNWKLEIRKPEAGILEI